MSELINLSIYKDEFIKIEEYIRPYVNEINVRPDLKKVFVYVCIFTIFIYYKLFHIISVCITTKLYFLYT